MQVKHLTQTARRTASNENLPTYIHFCQSDRRSCARGASAKLPFLLLHRSVRAHTLFELFCSVAILTRFPLQDTRSVVCFWRPGNVWRPQGPKSTQCADKPPAASCFSLAQM